VNQSQTNIKQTMTLSGVLETWKRGGLE